jgi:hypothetical protein
MLSFVHYIAQTLELFSCVASLKLTPWEEVEILPLGFSWL